MSSVLESCSTSPSIVVVTCGAEDPRVGGGGGPMMIISGLPEHLEGLRVRDGGGGDEHGAERRERVETLAEVPLRVRAVSGWPSRRCGKTARKGPRMPLCCGKTARKGCSWADFWADVASLSHCRSDVLIFSIIWGYMVVLKANSVSPGRRPSRAATPAPRHRSTPGAAAVESTQRSGRRMPLSRKVKITGLTQTLGQL
jgi:hypothetical protein